MTARDSDVGGPRLAVHTVGGVAAGAQTADDESRFTTARRNRVFRKLACNNDNSRLITSKHHSHRLVANKVLSLSLNTAGYCFTFLRNKKNMDGWMGAATW